MTAASPEKEGRYDLAQGDYFTVRYSEMRELLGHCTRCALPSDRELVLRRPHHTLVADFCAPGEGPWYTRLRGFWFVGWGRRVDVDELERLGRPPCKGARDLSGTDPFSKRNTFQPVVLSGLHWEGAAPTVVIEDNQITISDRNPPYIGGHHTRLAEDYLAASSADKLKWIEYHGGLSAKDWWVRYGRLINKLAREHWRRAHRNVGCCRPYPVFGTLEEKIAFARANDRETDQPPLAPIDEAGES